MNSYDYYLYHKHRMSWLGMDHREAQEQEIGSRNKHNDKGLGVDAYSAPIRATIHNLRNVIAPGGHFCVIVGDAILRGELVQMNTIFDQLFSEEGFSKTREIKFAQRRYTRAFTPNLRTRHKHSYALIYRR
jgi:site-specific DNA-methyltransferase (cytosine-N4-specific)